MDKHRAIILAGLLVHLLVVFATMLETFIYPGLLQAKVGVSLWMLIALQLIVLLASKFFQYAPKITSPVPSKLLYLGILFLFIAAEILTSIEHLTYTNFVFSQFHISIDRLFLLAFCVAVVWLWQKTVPWRQFIYDSIQLFVLFMIVLFAAQFVTYLGTTYRIIFPHPPQTYTEKLESTLGSFITYTELIKKYVPEDARISIPAMRGPWEEESNLLLASYFLYPRVLVQSLEGEVARNSEYVLILYGDGLMEGPGDRSWPDEDVAYQEVWLFRLDSKEVEYRQKGVITAAEIEREKWMGVARW